MRKRLSEQLSRVRQALMEEKDFTLTDLEKYADREGHEVISYSGRGMYGARCAGMVVPRSAIDDVLKEFPGANKDAMGMDAVLYWRFIDVPADYMFPPKKEELERNSRKIRKVGKNLSDLVSKARSLYMDLDELGEFPLPALLTLLEMLEKSTDELETVADELQEYDYERADEYRKRGWK